MLKKVCKLISSVIDVIRKSNRTKITSCKEKIQLKFQRKKKYARDKSLSQISSWTIDLICFSFETKNMGECLECVNNCLQFLNLCKPKDSTNNTKPSTSNDSATKQLINMNKDFTLLLPTRPKVNDEIRIKAKLKQQPKE